ncbi:hypothetical protein ACFU53_28340 [Streptomyces sp. NPDC057474]|uniref:hypothetical protein n=1 Tax=Streptomyces sp. NPDC057474 TaxID=3346144 RepID=UPI00368FAE5E
MSVAIEQAAAGSTIRPFHLDIPQVAWTTWPYGSRKGHGLGNLHAPVPRPTAQ